jgi:hypothetical protein
MNHPEPPDSPAWGKSLTEPEFITNQTGRLGVDIYVAANPEQVERANPHCGQHAYYPSHDYGE